MEDFVASILVLHDNINESVAAQKTNQKNVLKTGILEKQYLAYYIYRIWIKYRKLMESVNTSSEFVKVLVYLDIPAKYHDMHVVYPLVNKMISNENQLDLIILSITQHMNSTGKIFSKPDGPKSDDYDNLAKYLDGKSMENIVQDILQLKLLIPNLARPAKKFDVWTTYMPYLLDLEEYQALQAAQAAAPANNTGQLDIAQLLGMTQGTQTGAPANTQLSAPEPAATQLAPSANLPIADPKTEKKLELHMVEPRPDM